MATPESIKDDVRLPGWKPKQLIIVSLVIAACIFLIFALWHGLRTDPNKIPSALLDKPAHPFEVTWLQGKEHLPNAKPDSFALSDFKGQPIIVNFWASWCYSCRDEARDFEAFWQKYKDRGIKLAGIAIQDTPEASLAFAKSYGKTYILGLDSEEGKAAIDYGVTGVPETFFIDRRGVVIHKESGPVTAQLLAEWAEKLMASP